jgi:hypothetical protein
VADDLGGEDVADAKEVGERAAGGGDGLLAATAVLAQGAIEATDIGDQLAMALRSWSTAPVG